MSFRTTIFATACALTLAASPALATDFNGLLGVDYSHLGIKHSPVDGNAFGGNASGMFGLGSQFAVQADGGYHYLHLNQGLHHQSDWNVDGTAFWAGGFGRIGGVVGYDSTDTGTLDNHTTNYGGFGEFYATRAITFGVRGGAFDGNRNAKGDYAGAALTGYITPGFSLRGGYDYVHLNHVGNENDWSARVEYLFSERMPVAVYAGYTYSKISNNGPTSNVFLVGLTYFCDPTGPESLVAHQRTGAEEWGTAFDPVGLR